jgi:hypothetical protein
MKLSACLLGVLTLVALLVGCGDSNDSSDSSLAITTSQLSKAQFVKKADAICIESVKPLLASLTDYQRKHPASTKRGSEVVIGKAVKTVIPPVLRQQSDQIRSLGAPSGGEQQVEAFLLAMEAEADQIESGAPLTSFQELDSQFRRSGKLARQYGLERCAYG